MKGLNFESKKNDKAHSLKIAYYITYITLFFSNRFNEVAKYNELEDMNILKNEAMSVQQKKKKCLFCSHIDSLTNATALLSGFLLMTQQTTHIVYCLHTRN